MGFTELVRSKKLYTLLSVFGTAAGCSVLLKDYFGGKIYTGKESMVGKTVIVTGANSGIGKETARDLAKRGAKVIMACRNMELCNEARSEIEDSSLNHNIYCRKLDLASLKSVKSFVQKIKKEEKHLDVLVNNAGIMMCPSATTVDGFETQLCVNHLGPFLLTCELLDLMKSSAPSRIINVVSISYRQGVIDFEDLNAANKDYDALSAFTQSKLANMLFIRELSKRLTGTGVTVNAVHPGVVDTDIGRYMGIEYSPLSKLVLWPFRSIVRKTPQRGAQTSIFCAVDPSLEKISGKLFNNLVELPISENAQDDAAAKRLWAITEKWTKVT